MGKKVTAVFDIGKTNKKFFLFDEEYTEVHREYVRLPTITDEDGYPAEDIGALRQWLLKVFEGTLANQAYQITSLNFSGYGASWVYVDKEGQIVAPLYDYTKPFNSEIKAVFFETYGPEDVFTEAVGSPFYGMLNSGLQLYWLKKRRPQLYDRIAYALHLPQYLSYVFTGVPVSEYTSIGCHTALWDFEEKDYHRWVYQEGIHKKLPPIVPTETVYERSFQGKKIQVGVGIHDSSAALLPYIKGSMAPFVLVSTGTWSISLNPFFPHALVQEEVEKGGVSFLRTDGRTVRSARLFLGNEYKVQVAVLSETYGKSPDYHETVRFNGDLFSRIEKDFEPMFHWQSLDQQELPKISFMKYATFEEAYHQLLLELVKLQVECISLAKGGMDITGLYIDGGFAANETYVKMLTHFLREMHVSTATASLGSALGAALVLGERTLPQHFLTQHYGLAHQTAFLKT